MSKAEPAKQIPPHVKNREHHKPRRRGACALWALREHRVDDLNDELLTCARQLRDRGDLLLQLGGRAALGGLGRFADEFFDGHAERLGQRRQGRNRHAPPAGLETAKTGTPTICRQAPPMRGAVKRTV